MVQLEVEPAAARVCRALGELVANVSQLGLPAGALAQFKGAVVQWRRLRRRWAR